MVGQPRLSKGLNKARLSPYQSLMKTFTRLSISTHGLIRPYDALQGLIRHYKALDLIFKALKSLIMPLIAS